MSEIIREHNIKNININTSSIQQENIPHSLSQVYSLHKELLEENKNEEENLNENPYNESENSREDYLPVNKALKIQKTSIIKGILLAFIFFSVIIYSLLYLLIPEKKANIIFIGEEIFISDNNNTYILDNMIKLKNKNYYILNVSLYNNTLLNEKSENKNDNLGIIFKIENKNLKGGIFNKDNKLLFEFDINNFLNYYIKDFPFCIEFKTEDNYLYNLNSINLYNNLNISNDIFPRKFIF